MAAVSGALPDAWKDLLATAELVRELEPAARQRLLAAGTVRRVERRSLVFTAGDEARSLYLVVSGRIKLVRASSEGQEVILRFVGPGEVLGGVAALPAALYPATAEAVEDTMLAAWSREALAPLLAAHPEATAAILGIVSRRMGEVQGQLQELATERVAQRVASALLRLAGQLGRQTAEGILLDVPLSRQSLAEMTGTTLFTVSRLLSAWESDGLLRAGRERVTIRAPERLARIAAAAP